MPQVNNIFLHIPTSHFFQIRSVSNLTQWAMSKIFEISFEDLHVARVRVQMSRMMNTSVQRDNENWE